MKYRAYSEYKDSRVEWLGKIPGKWTLKKFKYLFQVSNEKNGVDPVGQMLSVSGYRGVEVKEYGDDAKKRTLEELTEYRVVRKGQLVVNTMWLNYAGLGVSNHEGYVSPAYRAYKFKKNINRKYVHHLLRSNPYVMAYTSQMQGIRPNSLQMKTDDFQSLPILLPSLNEQKCIADFLDYELDRIDLLIDKQVKFIELLKEKQQAVISNAVTKGLNSNVKFKTIDSQWIDAVPNAWGVMSLRYAISKIEQGSSPLCDNNIPEPSDIGVIKISAVKKGLFNELESKKLFVDSDFDVRYIIKKGDLLVTRGNTPELVADACYVKEEPQRKIMLSDLVYRLSPNKKVKAQFVCFALLSDYMRHQIKLDARGSSMTMAKVSQEHIKSWVVAIPPINEQVEIIDFLSKKLTEFDRLFDAAHKLIHHLKERRSALISAAVTGKIDVSNWQPDAKDVA